MLLYRRTSILESSAQTLVNTVNCVGIMGKGLAHAFKEREPSMFAAYKRLCDAKELTPGKLWLWRGADNWTLNFPTKMHWRSPSRLDWIEAGLKKFVAAYEAQGIREISFPRLGCGNGGLDWEDVRPLMEHYLSSLPIPVFIHDHTVDIGLPEHLEAVAKTLRSEHIAEPTFGTFLTAIERAVELAGDGLMELGSQRPLAAKMDSEHELTIQRDDCAWSFESEDLRGVWISLQRGLLTKDKAGWSVRGGGEPLISILSMLPHLRPVEVERSSGAGPEFAIELTPEMRKVVAAPQSSEQRELAWH